MFDILEGESLCYQYFIENKITNRTQLRESLKTNPIKELTKSFIENMFANYKQGIKTEVKKIKPLYKIVCFNDAHIPFHDDKVLQMIFELIRKEQPDELVLNGDIIDCYWESRFIKDPGSKEFLQHECNTFFKLIAGLRKYIPNTTISYICGNHEDRIKLETWKNPSFYGVSSLELPNLLKFDKLIFGTKSRALLVGLNFNIFSFLGRRFGIISFLIFFFEITSGIFFVREV